MKRRLRKKKRVGEFQELGFELTCALHPSTRAERDALLDRWIGFVESRGLGFGGTVVEGRLEGFVTRLGRGSATAEDQSAVVRFLASEALALGCQVGPLRDAWH